MTAAPGPFVRALRGAGERLLHLPRPAWWLVAAAWSGGIWFLSSQPSPGPSGSLGWSFLSNLFHAPLFGLLALWLALGLPRRGPTAGGGSGVGDPAPRWARLGRSQVATVLLLVFLWGFLDELHQGTTPGRDPSAADLATDLAATAAVLVVARIAGGFGAPRTPERRERDLRRALLGGLLACCATALVATLELA